MVTRVQDEVPASIPTQTMPFPLPETNVDGIATPAKEDVPPGEKTRSKLKVPDGVLAPIPTQTMPTSRITVARGYYVPPPKTPGTETKKRITMVSRVQDEVPATPAKQDVPPGEKTRFKLKVPDEVPTTEVTERTYELRHRGKKITAVIGVDGKLDIRSMKKRRTTGS